MNALDLLAGRKMMVMTDMKVEVELTIDKVLDSSYSRDLEESTPQNDWWPASETIKSYTVMYTNGARKVFDSLGAINVL